MNTDLLAEFYQQSLITVPHETISGFDAAIEDTVFVTEMFAELIIRECISIVEPTENHKAYAQNYLGGIDGLELLDNKVYKIKEHFGIEE